ncbi:MAG: multidrug ABC transporter ATP-binding protein [Formosa sp.]|jgi:putative ABC transport system permease protein|nr:multidrug ABC transporter ATP-binding protein [Formosa sp.]MBQ44725.1 multidrug ABC transporter ATP-binding protein [Porticoccaceae bacterium]|tara:strand:- start:15553 stop:16794 length:1242 start_codon:yes stop_codon:yes gene_type:complete
MKFLFESDTWKEVYDSLTKNKVRTFITMIGVWWGILLLIALLGAARGMENSFNRIFGDFATNSVFIWGQNTSIPFKGFQEGKMVRLKLSHVHKIKDNIEGVELVVPRSRSQALVVRNFLSGRYGVNGDYPLLDQIQKKKMLRGRFINQNDINSKRKSAVISEDVYKQLFDKNENPIGRYVQLNSMNFTVIGVFQNENVDMGPSSDIHIPFTTFQQIYNRGDRIGWMVVTGKPEYNIKQIEEDIKLLLRNLNKIHPRDKRALGSFNLGKEFAKITGFLKGMQFLTWFVGIATLIAGVFAIGNILLITVKERTKEIGVRRALGATPFEIKRQIVVEAVFLTLLSGVLGIITGGWILIVIDKVWGQGDDATLVNASVSIAVVFVALALLVLLGSLIGLIPAFKATRVKPIEALREE